MAVPRWIVVAVALLAAVPFGWLLGVAVAKLLIGPEFGVFPVLTIPLGWAGAIGFALAAKIDPWLRLAVLAIGTALLVLFV